MIDVSDIIPVYNEDKSMMQIHPDSLVSLNSSVYNKCRMDISEKVAKDNVNRSIMPPALYHLTCIVPVYNVEQYVEECVESLLQVSSICVEIILVDDGSTDASAEILDRYATQYAHIKVIHQPNGGLSNARNNGLREARGEYIAFIDSDDWVSPERLVALYCKAVQDKADLILGNILYIAPDRPEYSPFCSYPDLLWSV